MSEIEKLKKRVERLTEDEARQCNELLDDREVKAISVEELLTRRYSYYIPDYQRGYRWTKQEVDTLLDDIERACNDEEAHCLQPLVVKRGGTDDQGNEELVVIDGQQRLTTISIILAWCEKEGDLNNGTNLIKRPKIKYKTRKDSEQYLDNIAESYKGPTDNKNESTSDFDVTTKKGNIRNGNIDYYNMRNAYKTCVDRRGTSIDKIKNNLLKHCYLIFYKIKCDEKESEVFKRLNSGKISLTNAELTKALLLHDLELHEQVSKAIEWDEMIRFFEKDDFWYYICNEPEDERYKQTRLDFLIEIIADVQNIGDRYCSFRRLYNDVRKNVTNREEVWDKITHAYHIMKSWYEEAPSKDINYRSLYHLVGYLIKCSFKTTGQLVKQYKSSNRKQFKKHCIDCIKENLKIKKGTTDVGNANSEKEALEDIISTVRYGINNDLIKQLLLLMNISTLERNSSENSRYPFSLHVKNEWTLEHIHARNEKETQKRLMKYKEIIRTRRINLLGDEHDTEWERCIQTFESMYSDDKFDYETSIGNLALLPKEINSEFGNAPYQEKREMIAEICSHAGDKIIPICTRYAFFKYYTPNDESNIIWDGNNARDYTLAAINLISEYLQLK